MQATRNRARTSQGSTQNRGKKAPGTILIEAAQRNGVPLWALVGVKLSETGSAFTGAGATNPFEIEPGTASSIGVKDVSNFEEAADGAAKLLASYHRQFGSWNAAFEGYNGGPGAVGKGYAYDQAHVESKLAEFNLSELLSEARGGGKTKTVLFGGIDPLEGLEEFGELFGIGPGTGNLTGPGSGRGDNPAGEAGKAGVEGVSGAISGLSGLIELLTSGETWLRVGEVIAGALLLFLGLKSLTGVEIPAVVPVPV